MGMTGYLQSVTAAELASAIEDPGGVGALLWPDELNEARPRRIDLDQAWHGLHYLLCGDAYGGTGPLAQAILGGIPIGNDVGAGPARYLTASQVKGVAAALATMSELALGERFDPATLISNDIYPGPWIDGDADRDYLLHSYPAVVTYYEEAASRNDAMVFFIA